MSTLTRLQAVIANSHKSIHILTHADIRENYFTTHTLVLKYICGALVCHHIQTGAIHSVGCPCACQTSQHHSRIIVQIANIKAA